MRDSSIADAMVRDHGRIEAMVDELFKGTRSAEEVFFAVQKHFAMEEKATFNLKGSADPDERAIAMRLMREHDNTLILLRGLVELEEQWTMLVTKFKAMMMAHSAFEDEFFYPALDKGLARTKREHVVNQINEMAST